MNIDQFKARFENEDARRSFFESVLWRNGRFCPNCHCDKSYRLSGKSVRAGLHECAQFKRQFTVTSRTPMHSTKLPLWKWLLVMYYMVNSSKGVSSIFLAKWVGISQKSAWKLGHAIRKMMDPGAELLPALSGIVELDEKYIGGKPRYEHGVKHKRGRGTQKQ
jgi:transposase-like protein